MKIKFPWIEIILIIAGVLFFLSKDPNAFYLGIGLIVLAIVIFVARLIMPSNNHNQPQSYKPPKSDPYPQSMPDNSPKQKSIFSRRDPIEEENARKEKLKQVADRIQSQINNEIISVNDINYYSDTRLKPDDLTYIAQQLSTPFFSTSVWDLKEKINSCQLSDDQILQIIESGTENLVDEFFTSYSSNSSWNISSMLLEKLISQNSFMLYRFTNYRKETLMTIINRLSAYELQGYRMKPKESGEEYQDSFTDLQKSTQDNDVQISYYDYADTNMLHYLEENYPEEKSLRQTAFNKILSGSANLISLIEKQNSFSEDEINRIMERKYQEEISALFSSQDTGTIVNSFQPLYAVRVALQLVECDFEDDVKENYSFGDIPTTTYQEIIRTLSADELLGCDSRGDGNYDIIKLFEDNSISDEILRKIAFEKMLNSVHLSDAISRWDNITEDETSKILARKNEEEINALFGRDDSDDIICNLPEDVAIKIRLQLIYPDACDTVENNYQFTDKDAFRKVINELTADELLGFKSDPDNPGEFQNDADYDIIKLIEDEMSDNSELRRLAFAKICESKDMSAAISRWDNVTSDETATIMERKIEKEINALLGRDDSDSIVSDLPEDLAIKIRLQLIYPDAASQVSENYTFNDKNAFIRVINELTADELLGFKPDPNNPGGFANDADHDIIKFIEDDMGDDSKLRVLAFAKICESKDMSAAISRWDNVTEEEIAKIVDRGITEEVDALLGRDDSDDVLSNLPDKYVITQHLL